MTDVTCTITGCDKPQHRKSWCTTHYARWYDTGAPETPSTRIPEDAVCTVDGCDNQRKSSKGWCRKHYQKARRNGGNPLGGRTEDGQPQKHFADHLMTITSECKVWPYGKDQDGYGMIKINGQKCRVAVLVCEAWYGPKPNAHAQAAHGPCNDRACWNGAHLRWASPQENINDQLRDGTRPRGSRKFNARFIEIDIMVIRQKYEQGMPRQQLATEYGVVYNTIDLIVRRQTWKHVP